VWGRCRKRRSRHIALRLVSLRPTAFAQQLGWVLVVDPLETQHCITTQNGTESAHQPIDSTGPLNYSPLLLSPDSAGRHEAIPIFSSSSVSMIWTLFVAASRRAQTLLKRHLALYSPSREVMPCCSENSLWMRGGR
jgi:hypothetical protein